jgi:hypothetical protein
MSLLAGWFFEGAMLRHTPSLTDLAVWEIASGGSSKSPATREQPDGLQMTRRRTLAVAVNGRNMILRGDLRPLEPSFDNNAPGAPARTFRRVTDVSKVLQMRRQ